MMDEIMPENSQKCQGDNWIAIIDMLSVVNMFWTNSGTENCQQLIQAKEQELTGWNGITESDIYKTVTPTEIRKSQNLRCVHSY